MNYAERIAKGSFIIFSLGILASIIGYGLRIYLARNLEVSDFGLFYAVLSFIGFFFIFKDLGVGSSLAKFLPEFLAKKKYKEIKSSILLSMLFQLFIGSIIFIIVFSLSDYLSIAVFRNTEAKTVIQILSFEFLIAFPVMRSILQGLHRMKAYGSIELTRTSLVFLLVIFLAPLSIEKVALSYLISSAVIQITFFLFIYHVSKKIFKEKFVLRKKLIKKITAFSVLVFIASIASSVITYMDTILLTILRSLEEVGLYQVALPTSQMLLVFVTSLSVVLYPTLSEMWAKKQKRNLSSGVSLITKLAFVFIIPLSFIFIAFPEIVISNLFGVEYIDAKVVLQILSLSSIFYTLMIIGTVTINAIGKPLVATKIIILISIINLILNLILIPEFGIEGAAITTLVSYFIGFLLSIRFLNKYINMKFYWLDLGKSILLGLLTLGIIFFIKSTLIIDVILESVISLGIAFLFYFFLTLYTGIITKEDFTILNKMSLNVPLKIKKLILRFAK